MITDGNMSPVRVAKGALVEYTTAPNPLKLEFDFNPATITRTKTVTIKTGGAPGTLGGYDFENEAQAPRVSQGVVPQPETFSAKILLDATDRMNAGDDVAATCGVQPEIDILRTMLEPKSQTPDGQQTLAALGQGRERAFSRHQFASILKFSFGEMELPVFMTQVQIEIKAYLPNLYPYRAEATISLQVIESNNPIYEKELKRQASSALSAVGG